MKGHTYKAVVKIRATVDIRVHSFKECEENAAWSQKEMFKK
jgi:hypothetical protein